MVRTDTDAHPIVSLREVHKFFGENEVLKGVDLDVARGEVLVIFGRSGSGKSTLLRCINILEEPTSGSVEVDGILYKAGPGNRQRRKTMREIRSRTGMVFQGSPLYPPERDRERDRGPEDGQGDANGGGRGIGCGFWRRSASRTS